MSDVDTAGLVMAAVVAVVGCALYLPLHELVKNWRCRRCREREMRRKFPRKRG